MTMIPDSHSSSPGEVYTRIPVTREVMADLETPLSIYLKLADHPYSYLFESLQGGEKWGRYSIIGLPCRTVIRVIGHTITVEHDGNQVECVQTTDPLTWIATYQSLFSAPEVKDLPRFTGGLVGYFGYDTVRYIEPRLSTSVKPDTLATPDIMLLVSDEVIVFDSLAGKLYIIIHVDPAMQDMLAVTNRMDELEKKLRRVVPRKAARRQQQVKETDFTSGFSKEEFESAVRRTKKYIVDGDVMQVVLSQRLSIPYKSGPLDLYRALRTLNPSPYMYYLNLHDFHIVGSSPEILTRLENGVITVRPIAGTRPRGKTEDEDQRLEQELLADPKERAEHLMLIDLGRNDVGRVSEIGSVEVTERMIIERYSHVMHIVSNVHGKVSPGVNAIDVLRATFPAGTVSGAPKIRAMEIIDELEPVKRGVYAGAVGYIGWNGNMDTAIAIRTAVIKDKRLYVQAGAGIVADSIPAQEWDETMNKARAMFRAVSMVGRGMHTPVIED
jgi:anthranilate synthase component I